MYDVRQFRPTLYALLILGFSGFALAAQSPGLWALAVSLVLLNAWLIKRGYFFPLPRIVANLVTLSALLYIVIEVRMSGLAPILVIGQFLVLLQLVKVYEQRANRDYAQLLVLSLLLVVAASINTASLLFGIVLILYLFLSLYCCLLFHLKVEADHAKAAIALSEEKLNPASLRHDQRYLSRSMRKLTLFISGTAIVMAVIVFLFFPRGTGANLLAPLQQRAAQTLTGFSDSVSFQNIARITQNNEVVAHVRVWHITADATGKTTEQPIQGTTLMLRGTTLNVYRGGDGPVGSTWQWERRVEEQPSEHGGGDSMEYFAGNESDYPDRWKQEVWLNPTGTNVIFAMAGPIGIDTDRDLPRVRRFRTDEVLQTSDPLSQQAHYIVMSRNTLETRPPGFNRRPQFQRGSGGGGNFFRQGFNQARDAFGPDRPGRFSRAPEVVDEPLRTDAKLVAQFHDIAADPKISGSNERGPLAQQRVATLRTTALDSQIANNICNYLRNNFAYTLDLTDARTLDDGRDPLIGFLTNFKKGHCEYFAGAMAMLCQSLGMDARVVVGFKCDEYNSTPGANYYIVRQSHAHAWVEVRTPNGWETFDPTSSREAQPVQANTFWTKIKHVMDYLEYAWANSVVAYDRDNQGSLLKSTEAGLTNIGIKGATAVSSTRSWFKDSLRNWFQDPNFFMVSSKLLGALIYLAIFALIGAIGGFFWEKWKLRQRARRIGLENLPTSDKLRLARQLEFYDDLIQLLERYNITRPRHLTPLEFSDSITFLPNEAFDAVKRLTQIFYRIRYGGHQISYVQRQRLNRVISQVDQTLSKRGAIT